MVKAAGILVCLLVIAMDVVAAILGIKAEMEQKKVRQLRLLIFECKEPSHQALVLGLAAATLLVLAHLIATLLGGCLCICSQEAQKDSYSRQVSIICLVISWILLVIGLGFLGLGAKSNDKSRASCGLSHHRFFAMGGIVCFVHGIFCVSYYVSATASDYKEKNDSHA